jgi:hypothetical protein
MTFQSFKAQFAIACDIVGFKRPHLERIYRRVRRHGHGIPVAGLAQDPLWLKDLVWSVLAQREIRRHRKKSVAIGVWPTWPARSRLDPVVNDPKLSSGRLGRKSPDPQRTCGFEPGQFRGCQIMSVLVADQRQAGKNLTRHRDQASPDPIHLRAEQI